MDVLLRTVRMNIKGKISNSPAVYIFWHSKMLAGWMLFRNRKYSAIVSQSKDGEMLSSLLQKWSYEVYRGSSSKGGKEALEMTIEDVSSGNSAVITPDGPRGPALEIKNGPLIISNRCGVPVIPVKILYAKSITLQKSWDKFEIPLPFTKCEVIFGKENHYREFLNDRELKSFKDSLKVQM